MVAFTISKNLEKMTTFICYTQNSCLQGCIPCILW